jgi:hypothetical protein
MPIGMRAQPIGIAQRIPGPAGNGCNGQHNAERIVAAIDGRLLLQVEQLNPIDAADAGGDQQQRRQQLAPAQGAVALRVAAIRADRDHYRQSADDHRR